MSKLEHTRSAISGEYLNYFTDLSDFMGSYMKQAITWLIDYLPLSSKHEPIWNSGKMPRMLSHPR